MSGNGKVVIIGLDGATFRVLRPLVEAGVMPTVGQFMTEGAWGNLLSTRPPVTCPAWPSMFTGVGPGKHGVFSFSHRDVATGRVRTAAITDVRVPKLWDFVGEAGRKSAILNVPITFPAPSAAGPARPHNQRANGWRRRPDTCIEVGVVVGWSNAPLAQQIALPHQQGLHAQVFVCDLPSQRADPPRPRHAKVARDAP